MKFAGETGLDATFGRGTKGIDVLDAIMHTMRARNLVRADNAR